MPKPMLSSLFIIVLAVFAPTPGRAMLYCHANCPNSSCTCILCSSCGCTSAGDAYCGNSTAIAADTPRNTLAFIQPFAGDPEVKDHIDLSSLRVAREASHGVVRAGDDGSFLYSPDPEFVGLDSFAFTACDYSGECDTATVLVDVVPGE